MTSSNFRKLKDEVVRTASWAEKKKIRFLFSGMEDQRQRVMTALGRSHSLYDRMSECGTEDAWGKMKLCGIPLCPRCFMTRRRKETARATQKTFADIQNEGLVFLTLLAPVRVDINKVEEIQQDIRNRLRNIIDYRRRHDARWNEVQLTGWWEMDRITASDFDALGRNKRIAFGQLDWPLFVARADTTIWCPHLHAIVALGDVTRKEFAEALRGKGFDKAYQVDLQPFHTYRPVGENIQSVVRYSQKFRIEDDVPTADGLLYDSDVDERAGRNWWSDKAIRTYVEWLMRGRGNGFERLRVFIGHKKTTLSSSTVSSSDHVSVLLCDSVHDISIQDTNWLSSERPHSDESTAMINCNVPHAPAACNYDSDTDASEDSGSGPVADHASMSKTQNKILEFQLLKSPDISEQCQYASAVLYSDVTRVSAQSEISMGDVMRSSSGEGNAGLLQPLS